MFKNIYIFIIIIKKNKIFASLYKRKRGKTTTITFTSTLILNNKME